MKMYSYNISPKTKKGLYCDIDGTGQCYNVLLFLKAMSGRSLKGKIFISHKKQTGKGWVKLYKEWWRRNESFTSSYTHDLPRPKFFHIISFDTSISNARQLWIKVQPNHYVTI